MWKGLSLEGEIVRYSSVSLSPTLGKNEKVEQYIRKKTHKPNALRFWVEGGVIPLYVDSYLIVRNITDFAPSNYPTSYRGVVKFYSVFGMFLHSIRLVLNCIIQTFVL